jgi:hypothetical protein
MKEYPVLTKLVPWGGRYLTKNEMVYLKACGVNFKGKVWIQGRSGGAIRCCPDTNTPYSKEQYQYLLVKRPRAPRVKRPPTPFQLARLALQEARAAGTVIAHEHWKYCSSDELKETGSVPHWWFR